MGIRLQAVHADSLDLSCGEFPHLRMTENEYDYLEKALPGFTQARLIVKAAGDNVRPLGFKGSKFDSVSYTHLTLPTIYSV